MYASGTYGRRAPGKSAHRKSQSDPGHPFVTPPYTILWPEPARQTNELAGMTVGVPFPGAVERAEGLFVPKSGPFPTKYSPSSGTIPPTPVMPRSPSPQRQSSSSQGSIRAPQTSGTRIKNVPRPSCAASNASSAVTASHLYPASSGASAPSPIPVLSQRAGMPFQGSHHSVRPQTPASVYQGHPSTSATHLLHHHHPSAHQRTRRSPTYHVPNTQSPRPRPPSAASHRYASNLTPSVHGHREGSPAASMSESLTSLDVPSLRDHNPELPPPGMSSLSYYYSFAPGSPQRSQSYTARAPSPVSPATHAVHHPRHHHHHHHHRKLEKEPPPPPSPPPPPPKQPMAACEIRRSVHRPALPPNYDGQMQTRYVNMLLALDDIPLLYNVLAWFFTWIMLAGFLLLPGTFASLRNNRGGSPQALIANLIDNPTLYIVAFVCTGVGIGGILWLWWRWRGNYVWITNRLFIPGSLNSAAGVVSTLSNVFGTQGGTFGRTEKSAIIVTGSLSLIWGVSALVYEYWFIRNLRLEHDAEVGVELAGKHGEGVLVKNKRGDRKGGA